MSERAYTEEELRVAFDALGESFTKSRKPYEWGQAVLTAVAPSILARGREEGRREALEEALAGCKEARDTMKSGMRGMTGYTRQLADAEVTGISVAIAALKRALAIKDRQP